MKVNHYPILLVVVDSAQAQWFHLQENDIKKLDDWIDRYERYTDNEGLFKSKFPHSRSIKAGAPEVKNQRRFEHIRNHLRIVAKKTRTICEIRKGYKKICFVLPKSCIRAIQFEMQRVLPQETVITIPGLYMNSTPAQLHRLFVDNFYPSYRVDQRMLR